jgi:hypothetical protein
VSVPWRAGIRSDVGRRFGQTGRVLLTDTRCLRTTGESCYVMEIVATGIADLERITNDLAEAGSITTDVVYSVITDRPAPTTS